MFFGNETSADKEIQFYNPLMLATRPFGHPQFLLGMNTIINLGKIAAE